MKKQPSLASAQLPKPGVLAVRIFNEYSSQQTIQFLRALSTGMSGLAHLEKPCSKKDKQAKKKVPKGVSAACEYEQEYMRSVCSALNLAAQSFEDACITRENRQLLYVGAYLGLMVKPKTGKQKPKKLPSKAKK